jgi:hypothetical protein
VWEEEGAGKNGTNGRMQEVPNTAPAPSFERVKKVKKPLVPGLVKKPEPSAPAVVPTTSKPVSLGLGGYDSDDD